MSKRDIAPKNEGRAARTESEVGAFLDQLKSMPQVRPASGRGRLIFALDATASRKPSWDQACEVQGQMFREAERLGGLEVQLAFYRGFHECKASRWVPDAKGLVELMTRVDCRAGRTQIKRILQHAVNETKKKRVHALVFIGDACEEPVDELGALAGELGMLGVKAFMFQEGRLEEADLAFREIARLTKGAHCRFDGSSPKELRTLLGAVAAYAAGGMPALEDLGRREGGAVKLIESQLR